MNILRHFRASNVPAGQIMLNPLDGRPSRLRDERARLQWKANVSPFGMGDEFVYLLPKHIKGLDL